MKRLGSLLLAFITLIVATGAGLGIGYLLWGQQPNWYAVDVTRLGQGPEAELIRYGRDLVINTPQHIGKSATDPAMRYAGNDLACQNCHLNAGLQPFAAPFVSTFTTFPMLVDDQVLTLTDRINGCMRRSMNGKDLPPDSPEMEALIAYIKFVGKGTPEGTRCRRGPEIDQAAGTTPGLAARAGGLCQALRQLSQGGRAGGTSPGRDRLFNSPAVGRRELQCGRRHGQDRLCRVLYPRQHALRRHLPGPNAERAAGLGCGRLHDFEAAPGGDVGDRL
jgi:SoxA/TsdA, cytochrome c domain